MGKATIVAHLGEGRYTIEIERDIARITARLNKIDSAISKATIDYNAAAYAVDEANAYIGDLRADLDALLAAPPINEKEVKRLTDLIADLVRQRTPIEQKMKRARLLMTELRQEKAYLQKQKGTEEVDTWCTIYPCPEIAAGTTVGTIEIPGERNRFQSLIHPSGAYSAARDGILSPASANTPAGVAWNIAVLPGWQKWGGNTDTTFYRVGRVTAIDTGADTLDVNLEAEASTQQGLSVNAETSFAAVPIAGYITCPADVFEIGDRVVVEFTANATAPADYWKTPWIIGWADNPASCPCGTFGFVSFNDAARWTGGINSTSTTYTGSGAICDPYFTQEKSVSGIGSNTHSVNYTCCGETHALEVDHAGSYSFYSSESAYAVDDCNGDCETDGNYTWSLSSSESYTSTINVPFNASFEEASYSGTFSYSFAGNTGGGGTPTGSATGSSERVTRHLMSFRIDGEEYEYEETTITKTVTFAFPYINTATRTVVKTYTREEDGAGGYTLNVTTDSDSTANAQSLIGGIAKTPCEWAGSNTSWTDNWLDMPSNSWLVEIT